MATITAALLFLGGCLTGAGTLAFLAAAPAAPDPETLRIAYWAARYGRRIAAPGLAGWVLAWPTTSAGYALLLAAAAVAFVASYFVTRGAPELIRRAAAWSL